MASIADDPNGRRRILFVAGDGSRKTIRLGKMDRKTAETCRIHIERIIGAQAGGGSLPDQTYQWLADLADVLHGRLAAVGLVKGRECGRATLGPFIDAFIAGRPDVKPNTLMNMRQAQQWLVACFGAGRDMKSVTPADAEQWEVFMREGGLSENTRRRHIGRARQLWKAAIRRELVRGRNPFEGMAATVRSDRTRLFFVTEDMSRRVLDACPDAQWRLIFALARYGGLRTPSETLTLRWSDVDWDRGVFRVSVPKLEHIEGKASRMVPIFAELRPFLLEAFEQADAGAEYVITRYRDKACNLRQQLGRIIRRAGLDVWPKPWQNLRATRQTELADRFSHHVVCKWIGNSSAVAMEHYLQVTDAHIAQAVAGQAAQNPAQYTAELGGSKGKVKPAESEKLPVFPSDSTPYHTLPFTEHPRQDSNL